MFHLLLLFLVSLFFCCLFWVSLFSGNRAENILIWVGLKIQILEGFPPGCLTEWWNHFLIRGYICIECSGIVWALCLRLLSPFCHDVGQTDLSLNTWMVIVMPKSSYLTKYTLDISKNKSSCKVLVYHPFSYFRLLFSLSCKLFLLFFSLANV